MPAPQQNKPSFTPAFKKAFVDLGKLAGTNPNQMAAEYKDLTHPQLVAKLTEKFKLIQTVNPADPAVKRLAVEKMTAFVTTLNETMQDPAVAQQLEVISTLPNDNVKLTELKKFFLNKKVIEACASYFNMFISAQYRNKTADMLSVFDGNNRDAGQAMSHVDSQGNYDPEKKVVRDFMRLLYELFDIVLIQAGYKPIFMPYNAEHSAGMWDPKKGIMLPD